MGSPNKQFRDSGIQILKDLALAIEPFVKPGGDVGSAISLYHEVMEISDYDSHIKDALKFIRNL